MSTLKFEEWLVEKDFEEPVIKPKEKQVLTENFNSMKFMNWSNKMMTKIDSFHCLQKYFKERPESNCINSVILYALNKHLLVSS